jgi:hypothetical protein
MNVNSLLFPQFLSFGRAKTLHPDGGTCRRNHTNHDSNNIENNFKTVNK